jgi:hypothetical protein
MDRVSPAPGYPVHLASHNAKRPPMELIKSFFNPSRLSNFL